MAAAAANKFSNGHAGTAAAAARLRGDDGGGCGGDDADLDRLARDSLVGFVAVFLFRYYNLHNSVELASGTRLMVFGCHGCSGRKMQY